MPTYTKALRISTDPTAWPHCSACGEAITLLPGMVYPEYLGPKRLGQPVCAPCALDMDRGWDAADLYRDDYEPGAAS